MPFLMLGPSFSASFWSEYWPLLLVLVLLYLVFTCFYFSNRRLFLLLEKEDWPALVRYLEDKVIQKGHYSARLVRILANSYLVLSDSGAVMSLENKVAIAKPSLVNANVLVFGTARILGKDISGAIRFFTVRRDTVKAGLKEWVRWYCGFTMLLNRQYEEAGQEFTLLAQMSKDAVITALSAHFLNTVISAAQSDKAYEYREVISGSRERVLKALPATKDWNREVSRLSAEIHAAVLSKYMEEACRWLYGSK